MPWIFVGAVFVVACAAGWMSYIAGQATGTGYHKPYIAFAIFGFVCVALLLAWAAFLSGRY